MLLFVIAHKLLPSDRMSTLRLILVAGMSLSMLLLGAISSGLFLKGGLILVMLFVFFAFAWFIIVTSDEKDMIRHNLSVLSCTKP
jgi:hypothetical protein